MEKPTNYHEVVKPTVEFFRGLPKKLGEFVTRTFLSPYPLDSASHYESPLDEPLEPVTDWSNRTIPDVAGLDVSRSSNED